MLELDTCASGGELELLASSLCWALLASEGRPLGEPHETRLLVAFAAGLS